MNDKQPPEYRDQIYTLLENERLLLQHVETPKLRAECWLVIDALLDELIELNTEEGVLK